MYALLKAIQLEQAKVQACEEKSVKNFAVAMAEEREKKKKKSLIP